VKSNNGKKFVYVLLFYATTVCVSTGRVCILCDGFHGCCNCVSVFLQICSLLLFSQIIFSVLIYFFFCRSDCFFIFCFLF
jgi:hypothetical protein